MHVGLDESGFKVPAKKRPVVASRKNQVRGLVVTSTHDVVVVTVLGFFGLCLVLYHSFIGALTVVVPDVEFAIPSNGDEVRNQVFIFFHFVLFFLFFLLLSFSVLILFWFLGHSQ